MALVRGKDTGPEMVVRRALHAAGLRYTLHDKRLPGRPDIVLPSRRCVVEVRGCFWHRHPDPACPFTRTPKSRLEFWQGKFDENVARDHRNDAAMRELGWTIILVWECELARHGPDPVVEMVRALPVQPGCTRRLPKLKLKPKLKPKSKSRRGAR